PLGSSAWRWRDLSARRRLGRNAEAAILAIQLLGLLLGDAAERLQRVAQPHAAQIRAEELQRLEQRGRDRVPRNGHEQGEQELPDLEVQRLAELLQLGAQALGLPGAQLVEAAAGEEEH